MSARRWASQRASSPTRLGLGTLRSFEACVSLRKIVPHERIVVRLRRLHLKRFLHREHDDHKRQREHHHVLEKNQVRQAQDGERDGDAERHFGPHPAPIRAVSQLRRIWPPSSGIRGNQVDAQVHPIEPERQHLQVETPVSLRSLLGEWHDQGLKACDSESDTRTACKNKPHSNEVGQRPGGRRQGLATGDDVSTNARPPSGHIRISSPLPSQARAARMCIDLVQQHADEQDPEQRPPQLPVEFVEHPRQDAPASAN